MGTLVLLGLLGGGGFIALGRWIYSHPKTMYVSSLSAASDSPFRNSVARVFATLLIFLGSFGAASALAGWLLHRALVITLIGVAAGALGAAFLRPPVSTVPGGATGTAGSEPGRLGTLLSRKGRVFLTTMAAGVLLSTAEALSLPALGKGALWPDVALVTILVVAVAMLCEMLLLK